MSSSWHLHPFSLSMCSRQSLHVVFETQFLSLMQRPDCHCLWPGSPLLSIPPSRSVVALYPSGAALENESTRVLECFSTRVLIFPSVLSSVTTRSWSSNVYKQVSGTKSKKKKEIHFHSYLCKLYHWGCEFQTFTGGWFRRLKKIGDRIVWLYHKTWKFAVVYTTSMREIQWTDNLATDTHRLFYLPFPARWMWLMS